MAPERLNFELAFPDIEAGSGFRDPEHDPDRMEAARALGLDEHATWARIFAARDEKERAVVSQALGLEPYPAAKKYGLSEYPSWRNILMAILDLDTTASTDDIIARIKEDNRGL